MSGGEADVAAQLNALLLEDDEEEEEEDEEGEEEDESEEEGAPDVRPGFLAELPPPRRPLPRAVRRCERITYTKPGADFMDPDMLPNSWSAVAHDLSRLPRSMGEERLRRFFADLPRASWARDGADVAVMALSSLWQTAKRLARPACQTFLECGAGARLLPPTPLTPPCAPQLHA